MGRTLHYEVFYDRPLPHQTKREIRLAQSMLNYHFTWTCENLSLELFDEPVAAGDRDEFIYFSDQKNPNPRIGTGFTKVASDEWNACLVVTFLRWVSTRLPDAKVTVYDEGDYILAGFLRMRSGEITLDETRIARQRQYLLDNGYREELAEQANGVQRFRDGVVFGSLSVGEYLDRPEIQALKLTDKQLAKTTLAEVAGALVMPWDTEWLVAGPRRL